MAAPSKPLLIFDFDGTLANTLEAGIAIFNDLSGSYGLKAVTVDEVEELRKLNTRALLDQLGISRIMAVKLGAHIRKVLHQQMDQVEMIQGVKEAVLDLHGAGYQLGILSSNSAGNVRMVLERFELLDCFNFIEAGVSLFGKSHRILSVLRKENISAESAIYVGDETRDMEAARDSKVTALAVCWGANGREAMETEGPEFCIDHPRELIGCASTFEKSSAI
ncbi:MAG: HAD-IA family hydrolase [Verrucomicrobiales bacterium]|nr:HAD-IA family hydrolase [Verrucomicrobiales bacterium]